MNVTLKAYQERAVDSAVAVFDHCRRMLDAAGDDAQGRATAVHDNGYLLIEAPTGSGKTLMAGNVIERASSADRVVWFWFAPFKGVTEQAAGFLREQFPGLRLRPLGEDRQAIGTRAGDAFVTTWSMVATRIRDRSSVRTTGEQNGSVDDLIVSLREQGFRIGVVMDEAHHGFHGDTQAAVFFRTVLQPEYTVLITATPDDDDLRDLQRRMQIGRLHRITISRQDAVGDGKTAGLIKSGIKCVAWWVEEGSDALVDFQTTALREATTLHKALKAELAAMKVQLTPLMLVQVDGRKGSVDAAKETLIKLGFTEAQIATHTADEPDARLLTIANDEQREVLIFKMAVALGFDAPRAWTLVSMRASRDEDFGVQLVGRVLRVHRRLQGRVLPDALKYGYVLLADIDAQGGIHAEGQRINQLQTQFASVSPTRVVVRAGDRDLVQSVGSDGQTTFVPAPPVGSVWVPPVPREMVAQGTELTQTELFAGAIWTAEEQRSAVARALRTSPVVGPYRYA